MATPDGELVLFIRSVRSLKECIVAGKSHASMAEVWASQTKDKTLKLRFLGEGLTLAVDGELTEAAGLFEMELSHFCLVITAALTESEGAGSEAICSVQDGFPVKVSCTWPYLSAGISSRQPSRVFSCTLFLCFALANVE